MFIRTQHDTPGASPTHPTTHSPSGGAWGERILSSCTSEPSTRTLGHSGRRVVFIPDPSLWLHADSPRCHGILTQPRIPHLQRQQTHSPPHFPLRFKASSQLLSCLSLKLCHILQAPTALILKTVGVGQSSLFQNKEMNSVETRLALIFAGTRKEMSTV